MCVCCTGDPYSPSALLASRAPLTRGPGVKSDWRMVYDGRKRVLSEGGGEKPAAPAPAPAPVPVGSAGKEDASVMLLMLGPGPTGALPALLFPPGPVSDPVISPDVGIERCPCLGLRLRWDE